MAEAALLRLPYPETEIVEEDTLGEQSLALALALPERPLVLGGCCCVHVGAVEGLAARYRRLAVVWIDAHGDLNTPETSPSGNAWGMPLRMVIDSGVVRADDVALVGARSLDPPEEAFIAERSLALGAAGLERAADDADGVYVALDADALDEREISSFMPEPDGLSVAEAEALLAALADAAPVVGLGFSGLIADERNIEPVTRLSRAAGLETVD
jgi:arginase